MPKLLYYRGNIEIINHYKNVAVIGSRKVSEEGMQLSYIEGREVAQNGLNLVNGGCILSEYPEGTAIQKYLYVERDRLQSGISQAILVVEAEMGSGTMHTADFMKSILEEAEYEQLTFDFEENL